MEQLESQLSAPDIRLEPAVLDRIDELVAPGTNVNPEDAGWRLRADECPQAPAPALRALVGSPLSAEGGWWGPSYPFANWAGVTSMDRDPPADQ